MSIFSRGRSFNLAMIYIACLPEDGEGWISEAERKNVLDERRYISIVSEKSIDACEEMLPDDTDNIS